MPSQLGNHCLAAVPQHLSASLFLFSKNVGHDSEIPVPDSFINMILFSPLSFFKSILASVNALIRLPAYMIVTIHIYAA
jgi:hypothetical protein